jgi:hypothetical protein
MKRILLVATIALIAATAVHADPYPHRKPGLWQVSLTMTDSKLPPVTSKYCIDAATESALMGLGQSMMKNACSQQDVHVAGGKGTIDTVCKFGQSTQTSHTVIAFTGDTAYHSATRSHMQPAMFGKSDHSSTTDAKWIGPCPGDMKPGDVIMANGLKMNISPSTHQ